MLGVIAMMTGEQAFYKVLANSTLKKANQILLKLDSEHYFNYIITSDNLILELEQQ